MGVCLAAFPHDEAPPGMADAEIVARPWRNPALSRDGGTPAAAQGAAWLPSHFELLRVVTTNAYSRSDKATAAELPTAGHFSQTHADISKRGRHRRRRLRCSLLR